MQHLTQLCTHKLSLHSEEFFRLKKVQAKKKEKAAASDKERSAHQAQRDSEQAPDDAGSGDLLNAGKDDDVIF